MSPEEIAALEAAQRPNAQKRKRAEARIQKILKIMEPAGENAKRYAEMFAGMSDKDFHRWVEELRDGKRKLVVYAPNMQNNLQVDDLLKAADAAGAKLFHHLEIYDPVGDRTYLTPQEYLVLKLPVRRLEQTLDAKMSLPMSDKRTDIRTGQVVGVDKSSSISMTEMNTYMSKGLHAPLVELTNVRGGNTDAYAEFSASLAERGYASLTELDPDNRIRSAETANIFLKAMHIDTNL